MGSVACRGSRGRARRRRAPPPGVAYPNRRTRPGERAQGSRHCGRRRRRGGWRCPAAGRRPERVREERSRRSRGAACPGPRRRPLPRCDGRPGARRRSAGRASPRSGRRASATHRGRLAGSKAANHSRRLSTETAVGVGRREPAGNGGVVDRDDGREVGLARVADRGRYERWPRRIHRRARSAVPSVPWTPLSVCRRPRFRSALQLRDAQEELGVLGPLEPALLDALLHEGEALLRRAFDHVVVAHGHEAVAGLVRQRVLLGLGAGLRGFVERLLREVAQALVALRVLAGAQRVRGIALFDDLLRFRREFRLEGELRHLEVVVGAW